MNQQRVVLYDVQNKFTYHPCTEQFPVNNQAMNFATAAYDMVLRLQYSCMECSSSFIRFKND